MAASGCKWFNSGLKLVYLGLKWAWGSNGPLGAQMGQFGAQKDKLRAQMANLEFKWAILGSKGAN